ncbi:hypothetical protein [Reinekea blandensis]|uniref:Uncharacterized protein n=1 Tax=Reinekea blandensis MED297 TaxID=314283 RepID=A4BAQ9_9GAMM|nr:hypothetical protein [Reinekea blandensis]EAR11015.1 hypothetical protein MED297_10906 [Reinekea sp. MED297] [Reinekea blandensis MED297]
MRSLNRFVHRLWIGDFSQGQAFWAILIPALLLLKFSIAMLSLMNVIADPVVSTRIWLPIGLVCFIILLPLLFAATLKSIWIAAQQFKGGYQSLLLAAASAGLMFLVVSDLYEHRSVVQSMWQIALKQDDFSLQLKTTENRLQLSGALTYDSTQRVRTVLNQSPQIDTVELDLSGGHLHEARQLSALITQRQLNTAVRNECSGTCMLVLVGGLKRTAWPESTLRFHRTIGYDNGYRSEWTIERERRADQQLYARRGVSESYLFPIFYPQKNDAYLEPGLDVLKNTGVLTHLADATTPA